MARPVSAAATAEASAGRAAGALASMRWSRSSSAGGTSGRRDEASGAGSITTFISTWSMSPVKGGSPVRHLKSTQARENTSARASTLRSPRACSGEV